ncbi:hypothetical protein [Croceivirga sp. JEA036]|uniref:hypothetical protein n=1 Tax=Croceivirga sp. JEA036 TaxID=2721162 RepID=UPI00143A7269|nr:hypothetical protein [Croceivirga sp. JEA036]NJB37803.1 hypothetical protein [Croceivirga sp. JEA036]
MKYIVYLLLLILASCGPEAEMFQRQYVIENGTGVPVELQFYRDGSLSLGFETILLQNQERIAGLELDRSGGPWTDLSSEQLLDRPSASFESDSVRLIFNNEKIITYKITYIPLTFSPTERNLLRDTDYTSIGGDKFLFTINESDFENAEDCNGNCE